MLLWGLSYMLLYVLFMSYAPRGYREFGMFALFPFLAGSWWKVARETRNNREYLKLHPAKDHLKPSPSQ
jgi:hypothetical protein